MNHQGKTSNDFELSGPSHLTTVNWQNERHQRSIIASLVKGVYVQEDDRQQNRKGCQALAPPWWEFFNFMLLEVLIDDDDSSLFADSSIFGAVYEFKPKSNNYYPIGAPRYVIAFRGTMLKKDTIIRDTILNINILTNNLSHRSRSDKAIQAVENIISGKGASNIWLAGHSLGAALAILVGKNMAHKGNFLESYFFNPPFVAAPMKRRIKKARTWIKAALTVSIKDYQERQHSKTLFNVLCKWVPKLFLHESDLICAGYVRDFEIRESMESDGVGDVERLAAQNTMRGLITGAFGMDSLLNFFGINCSDQLHLLPSASLTTSCTPKRQAHSLNQWFTDESVSDPKVYSMGNAPNPVTSQTDNSQESTPPPLVGQATMFEITADVSTLYGCGNFVLVYNFWVPPEHKDFYRQIVETYGHIPTLLSDRPEMNTFVNVTRLLLEAAVEMTHLGESFPSEEKLSSWRSALDHARFLKFNISWLEEFFKDIKNKQDLEKKRDTQQELLLIEIARLKEEVESLQLTRVPLVQEAAEVEVKITVFSGDRILFWQDKWNGINSLKDSYNALYSLSRNKKDTIKDCISEDNAWNLHFKRNLNATELGEVVSLLQDIGDPTTFSNNSGVEDQRNWIAEGGNFSVSNCYKSLDLDGFLVFPHKQLWNSRVPTKVSFLVWTLCYDGAPTLDYLHRAGKVNNSQCLFCNAAQETNSHLFMQCPEILKLWNYFMNNFNINWVFSDSVKATLWEWPAKKGNAMRKKLWGMLPFAIWWNIWNERNSRLYGNRRRNMNQLIIAVKCTIYNWCRCTKLFEKFSLSTVICNWDAVLA